MGEGRRKEGRKGGKQRKTINRERHLERERQKNPSQTTKRPLTCKGL